MSTLIGVFSRSNGCDAGVGHGYPVFFVTRYCGVTSTLRCSWLLQWDRPGTANVHATNVRHVHVHVCLYHFCLPRLMLSRSLTPISHTVHDFLLRFDGFEFAALQKRGGCLRLASQRQSLQRTHSRCCSTDTDIGRTISRFLAIRQRPPLVTQPI